MADNMILIVFFCLFGFLGRGGLRVCVASEFETLAKNSTRGRRSWYPLATTTMTATGSLTQHPSLAKCGYLTPAFPWDARGLTGRAPHSCEKKLFVHRVKEKRQQELEVSGVPPRSSKNE